MKYLGANCLRVSTVEFLLQITISTLTISSPLPCIKIQTRRHGGEFEIMVLFSLTGEENSIASVGRPGYTQCRSDSTCLENLYWCNTAYSVCPVFLGRGHSEILHYRAGSLSILDPLSEVHLSQPKFFQKSGCRLRKLSPANECYENSRETIVEAHK